MKSPLKFKRVMISTILLLVISVLSIVPAAAQGTLLASLEVTIFAQHPGYFPLGVSFDGKNLWYSQPEELASHQPGIFLVTTTGTILQTLSIRFPEVAGGAIAWDGSTLWVATFQSTITGAALFQVSVGSTPTILKTLNLDAIFAPDTECALIDGLGFDPFTATLWVSPDVGCNQASITGKFGVAYNIDTSGNLIQRIQFPFSVSGVTKAGKSLYVVDRFAGIINQVNLNGNVQSSFPIAQVDPHDWAESISFDPTTFSGNCAVWAMQPYSTASGGSIASIVDHADLAAYGIPCD